MTVHSEVSWPLRIPWVQRIAGQAKLVTSLHDPVQYRIRDSGDTDASMPVLNGANSADNKL